MVQTDFMNTRDRVLVLGACHARLVTRRGVRFLPGVEGWGGGVPKDAITHLWVDLFSCYKGAY